MSGEGADSGIVFPRLPLQLSKKGPCRSWVMCPGRNRLKCDFQTASAEWGGAVSI